ncbi:MAG: NAD(+) synthase [Clostridiales bacterium]|nr:NAD(+) synthase [Clostridiales bacterium]
MIDGFIKVGSGTAAIRVADCEYNKNSALTLIKQAAARQIKLLALPELCLTGYSCRDLFLQDTLLSAAEAALSSLLAHTSELDLMFAVGLPVKRWGKLYNCAAVCCHGDILGLVPKTIIPNYGELCEGRYFSQGEASVQALTFAGRETFMGTDLVFPCDSVEGLSVGVEIGEDLCSHCPPSQKLSTYGATLIMNLSADSEGAAKAAYRESLVKSQSARLICAYIYAGAGEGESTTDMVFSGHRLIAENGLLLQSKRFSTGLCETELDISRLSYERRRMSSFPSAYNDYAHLRRFSLSLEKTALSRKFSPLPFVPEDPAERKTRCEEVLQIAALGLKNRIEHTGCKSLVLGVSGGLDSTLAALICARAMDTLSMSRESLIAVTMPCFGTTERTLENSKELAEKLSASLRIIDISTSVRRHFSDIGHSEDVKNSVYENAQARERTQVLMDIANGTDGLVVGTGDMSELALGWATYNGDHMSMYAVNSGIPKTLVRHLVEYILEESSDSGLKELLSDILDTPVSPELLPAEDGEISQKTEELVGPYELHDFFLYYFLRWGYRPKKILRLAQNAFEGVYDEETIVYWLKVFLRRFFSQQFKRSCLPDGPKVGSVSLSPRAGLQMPSDAMPELWLGRL